MSPLDPADLDEELEVSLGRRAPFSQLGDWVLLSGADSDARTLYWGLSAHINVTRDDTEVWPGLRTLARILQLKKPEQATVYMLQLEVLGAIDVIRSTIGLVRRNRYVVHQTPPRTYRGPMSMADWYATNRAPKNEAKEAAKQREAEFDAWLEAVRLALRAECKRVAAERTQARKANLPEPSLRPFIAPDLGDFRSSAAPKTSPSRTPKNGGTVPPAETRKAAGRAVPPKTGVRTPKNGGPVPPKMGVEQDQEEQDQKKAPCGRVSAPGDARRASTGSSARATRSGSAASSKTSPATDKPTAEAVRTVVAALPDELRKLESRPLPARIPARPLGDLIRGQLEHRTAQQLAERIARRWIEHRWAEKCHSISDGEPLRSGVGIAVELLAAPECPDPRCEDGTNTDTGSPCRACPERHADYRAARRDGQTVPPARSSHRGTGGDRTCCEVCERPFRPGTVIPDDLVCPTCCSELEQARAALLSSQTAPAAV